MLISVDIAPYEIFRAKVIMLHFAISYKGNIMSVIIYKLLRCFGEQNLC